MTYKIGDKFVRICGTNWGSFHVGYLGTVSYVCDLYVTDERGLVHSLGNIKPYKEEVPTKFQVFEESGNFPYQGGHQYDSVEKATDAAKGLLTNHPNRVYVVIPVLPRPEPVARVSVDVKIEHLTN